MYTEKGSFGISISHLWTDYWIDFVAWPMISFCSDEPGVTAHICIRSYKTGRSLPHIYIYFLWEAWENFIQLLTYQPVICNQLMLLKRCAQTPSVLTGSFQIAKERFYLHVPGTPHIWWKNLWIWEFMKSEAHEKWCGWWGWWWWWWWLLLVLLLLLSLWWLRWLWWWWSYAMNFCDTVIFLR